MTDSPLLFTGGSLFTLYLAIFILRLSFFRTKINDLIKSVGQIYDKTHDVFEGIIYARRKNQIDHQRILDLAAKCDAWKDTERKLEKWYKSNKRHEKNRFYFLSK